MSEIATSNSFRQCQDPGPLRTLLCILRLKVLLMLLVLPCNLVHCRAMHIFLGIPEPKTPFLELHKKPVACPHEVTFMSHNLHIDQLVVIYQYTWHYLCRPWNYPATCWGNIIIKMRPCCICKWCKARIIRSTHDIQCLTPLWCF